MSEESPLEESDAQDKEKLSVFRYFRRHWLDMLVGNDEHSISLQLTRLFEVDLEFRTINFSRKISEEEGVQQNGFVHDLIDLGFVAHQAMTIRRITEDHDGSKRKAVFSIPRVVSEMQEHADLITRETYVCAQDGKYDWSTGDWQVASRHRVFDDLSKTELETRKRDDRIHPDAFRELRGRLKSSEMIRAYANKYLAHAADPSTRSQPALIKLQDFEKAYADLAWATRRLCAVFLYGPDRSFLPMYNYDTMSGITNPICPSARVDDLYRFWSERSRQLDVLERPEL